MTEEIIFNLMLACFITHEIDAVDKKEWRMLFVLRKMNDKRAAMLFMLLHVPLCAVVLSLVYSTYSDVSFFSRLSLALFAVIHLWLHWRLRNHPKNQFAGPISYGPIAGAAMLGGLYICYSLAS
ncbi:MAG TPA: hypothetical protein DDW52_05560 [Planctomycetaceae bacterium]|nr:hypothetical protein [Planctomycetaceae bacterium]